MSREIGAIVEAEATALLKRNKLKIIATNFNTKFGELDIVAIEKATNTLVVTEVKYRATANYGSANEMLSYAKQKKIVKTVQLFLSKNPQLNEMNIRFDLIAKTGDNVEWIKNVIEHC